MTTIKTGKTGLRCPMSGVHQSMCGCGHSERRPIPKGHMFPPCSRCHRPITWVLIEAARTK